MLGAVGHGTDQLGIIFYAPFGQRGLVPGKALLDIVVGKIANESDALMPVIDQVRHGRAHACVIVGEHRRVARRLCADGHNRHARIRDQLDAIGVVNHDPAINLSDGKLGVQRYAGANLGSQSGAVVPPRHGVDSGEQRAKIVAAQLGREDTDRFVPGCHWLLLRAGIQR